MFLGKNFHIFLGNFAGGWTMYGIGWKSCWFFGFSKAKKEGKQILYS